MNSDDVKVAISTFITPFTRYENANVTPAFADEYHNTKAVLTKKQCYQLIVNLLYIVLSVTGLLEVSRM